MAYVLESDNAWADATALLEPLHEALARLHSAPSSAAVGQELNQCLLLLARASSPTPELAQHAGRAQQLVMALIAGGLLSKEHVSALRRVYDLCTGAAFDEAWCETPAATASSNWLSSGFRASRRRPRVQQLLPPPSDDDGAFMRRESPSSEQVLVDYSVSRCLEHQEIAERTAHSCLDDLAMLSRHRLERRMDEAANEERRILRLGDAFTVVGADAPTHLRSWWNDQGESTDAYRSFAVAYALSVCAGSGMFRILGELLQTLPNDAHGDVEAAANALELVARPERNLLVAHWQRSPSPVLRAVAIDLGSRKLGKPPEIDPLALCRWLVDPSPCVLVATLRGLARARHIPSELVPNVEQLLLGGVSARVSFEAARCLALCGSVTPYHTLRTDGRLLDALGERALEVLLWFGNLEDTGLFAHILQSRPPTSYTIECAALFGVPESYAYLLHTLEQEDLEDDAKLALETLFGPIHEDLAKDPAAWKRHIRHLGVQSGVRYRFGRPWAPAQVGAELSHGLVSRRSLERRLDELSVRLGGLQLPALNDWEDSLRPELDNLMSGLANLGSKLRPGDYYCHPRERNQAVAAAAASHLSPKPVEASSARL
ncbi:MAG: hypothetical protein AB7K71_26185 [Polyangiaceae bacterium]